MGLALIHHDPDEGPVGVWRLSDGALQSYYPEQHVEHHCRATAALAESTRVARAVGQPLEEYLRTVARPPALLDSFHTVETGDSTDLATVLSRYISRRLA
jgi:hypothetical protein